MDCSRRLRSGVLIATLMLSSCRSDPSPRTRPVFADTPFPPVVASADPAIVARGRYLVNAVAHCTVCHRPEASLAFADPAVVDKAIPTGGHQWDMRPMAIVRSPNLTTDPVAGIGRWSDAEIARAIKYGVDRQGRSLFFMNGLGYYDDRDLVAIVSYLRSLPPRGNVQRSTAIPPGGLEALRRDAPGFLQPKPQHPVPYAPQGGISVARGTYLAWGPGQCVNCHSDTRLAPRIEVHGPPFAGSMSADVDRDEPTMEINAPNLTPSVRYGAISGWSEDAFVARFKAGGRTIRLSLMPWDNFRLMTENDLRSIYRYLRSLPAADRDVGPSYRPKDWKPSEATPATRQKGR